ncbi:MAG: SIMPL domain-containing protein [Peptostreptococcaceae bacterium]|nr:SIMPL domain-containing protein [Peptostreptococcaceae bacterium]
MKDQNKSSITLIAIALILSFALIYSTSIAVNGIVKIKSTDTLTVKGSAKQEIRSDFVVWSGGFSNESADLSSAYEMLSQSRDKVRSYLEGKGIASDDIVFSSISTYPKRMIMPNGMYSNVIESYELNQTVEISSNDIDGLTEISRNATDLINQGVAFNSYPPQYFYTGLSDLKIDMIARATEDSKLRAEKMLGVTGSEVGTLKDARVGVFQITPLYSNEISDYGINDTNSIMKEITSVVECTFEVK